MNTLLTLEEFWCLVPSSNLKPMQVEMYLQSVTELVHDIAGVSLEEGEVTQIIKGNGSETLFLNKRPIKEIKKISSNRGVQIEDITINGNCTGINKKSGIFYQGQDITESFLVSKTTGSEVVEITYTGGFVYPKENVKGNVPIALKMACAGLINSFELTLGKENGLKSYSRDDVSYTFKNNTERDEKFLDTISKYVMK